MSIDQLCATRDDSIHNSGPLPTMLKVLLDLPNHTTDDLDKNSVTRDVLGVAIPQMTGQLDYSLLHRDSSRSTQDWIKYVSRTSAFTAYDDLFFGDILVFIEHVPKSNKFSSTTVSQFGITSYTDILITEKSRFWPACENLNPEHHDIPIYRILAISLLKNYNRILNHSGALKVTTLWDETVAGRLASSMRLLSKFEHERVCLELLHLGILQPHRILSVLIDYAYSEEPASEAAANVLASCLGQQIGKLFDPLLEYSPERVLTPYKPPSTARKPSISDSSMLDDIISELLVVQVHYTTQVNNLLRELIIPIRSHAQEFLEGGLEKINGIFPPTIDEIARIEGLFKDALLKAKPFGYTEVLKAVSECIPYSYKAYIRHEASTKEFVARYQNFYARYVDLVFGNDAINIGNFSLRDIDDVVRGCLLHLPKIRMLLQRFLLAYETAIADLTTDVDVQSEAHNVRLYCNSAFTVIDAFGGISEKEVALQLIICKRVFTPSGRALSEYASNWPPDLQLHLLNRKVVGIYDLRDALPGGANTTKTSFILVLFTDYALFLSVDQTMFRVKNDDNVSLGLSMSDILMHALVNEKPLPRLEIMPGMKAEMWCKIEDIFATCYDAPDSSNKISPHFIRFVSTCPTGFSTATNCPIYSHAFEITADGDSTATDATTIMDNITKAQIIHKKRAFHLFKDTNSGFTQYFSTQLAPNYSTAPARSPIFLLLNGSQLDIDAYFREFDYLNLVLLLSIADDESMNLVGYNRDKLLVVSEKFSSANFGSVLKAVLVDYYDALFRSFNRVTESVIQGNRRALRQISQGNGLSPVILTQGDMVLPSSHKQGGIGNTLIKSAQRLSREFLPRPRSSARLTPRLGTTMAAKLRNSHSPLSLTVLPEANKLSMVGSPSAVQGVSKKASIPDLPREPQLDGPVSIRSEKEPPTLSDLESKPDTFVRRDTPLEVSQPSSSLQGTQLEFSKLYKPSPDLLGLSDTSVPSEASSQVSPSPDTSAKKNFILYKPESSSAQASPLISQTEISRNSDGKMYEPSSFSSMRIIEGSDLPETDRHHPNMVDALSLKEVSSLYASLTDNWSVVGENDQKEILGSYLRTNTVTSLTTSVKPGIYSGGKYGIVTAGESAKPRRKIASRILNFKRDRLPSPVSTERPRPIGTVKLFSTQSMLSPDFIESFKRIVMFDKRENKDLSSMLALDPAPELECEEVNNECTMSGELADPGVSL